MKRKLFLASLDTPPESPPQDPAIAASEGAPLENEGAPPLDSERPVSAAGEPAAAATGLPRIASCPAQLHNSLRSVIWFFSQRYRNPSVADPGCLSQIQIFSIPDPNFFHSGSAVKNFEYCNTKKLFLSSRKYDPGCSSRIRLFPIQDPGPHNKKRLGEKFRKEINCLIFL